MRSKKAGPLIEEWAGFFAYSPSARFKKHFVQR